MVRKPLTTAHKAKIAARMRRYHNTCKKSSSSATTKKKKKKFVAPKVMPKGDIGAKLGKATTKIERREAIKKAMAFNRKVRRERQRKRDKKRYNYRKSWGGLLDVSTDIFVWNMNLSKTLKKYLRTDLFFITFF